MVSSTMSLCAPALGVPVGRRAPLRARPAGRAIISCRRSTEERKGPVPASYWVDRQPLARDAALSALAVAVVRGAAVATCLSTALPPPAEAVLNSPNVQIPRSVDAALRRSIPAFNPVAEGVQKKLEEIQFLLRIPQRKPWGNMAASTASVIQTVADRQALLSGVPPEKIELANSLVDDMESNLKRLSIAVGGQDADKTSQRVALVLKDIGDIEILEAPGLPFIVNKQYASMPRLEGRAIVELTVAKANGSSSFVDVSGGDIKKVNQATVQITLDGYSAPITAGNFAVNVMDGKYDKVSTNGSFQSFVAGPTLGRTIPLEIMPAGEFEPEYRFPLDVQTGELPVLPLSINGAVAMTHVKGSDSVVDADQFFVYKFDKQQAGLAGLAFDEGTFGVFGYVTEGMDILSRLEEGDIIKSAKIVAGADKLIVPATSAE